MFPTVKNWETPFVNEIAMASAGLVLGFFSAAFLGMCALHIESMMSSQYFASNETIYQSLKIATWISLGLTLGGCAIAIVPMWLTMVFERVMHIDLGAVVWMALGLLPVSFFAYTLVGGGTSMTVFTICLGGFPSVSAYTFRNTTGSTMTANKWLLMLAGWTEILVLACCAAAAFPVQHLRAM